MKVFYLKREEDESGISGTGIYDNIGEVHAIHGHGGKTSVEFEPDYKRACNEMKSFIDNFSLPDLAKDKLPTEGAAAKLIIKN